MSCLFIPSLSLNAASQMSWLVSSSKSISFEMGISYQQTSSKLTKYNPLNIKEIIDVFGFSVGVGILL